ETHHARLVHPRRHAIDERDGAFVRFELGFENERVVAIAARHFSRLTPWGDEPATVLRFAQERGEAGPGVETRQAEPIDRAIFAHERRRVAIANQSVILNVARHGATFCDRSST